MAAVAEQDLVVLAGGGLAYAGIVQVPVLSAAFGMDTAPDVQADAPDAAAYTAFEQEHGLVHTSPDANYTLSSKHHFAGEYALDALIPEAVILATRTLSHDSATIRDVAVNFHDGHATAGAFVDASAWGYPAAGPVLLDFTLEATGPTSVRVGIERLELGRTPVPADIAAKAEEAVNAYLASRLPTVEGLRIDALELREDGVYFRGTLPSQFGSDAPVPGQLP